MHFSVFIHLNIESRPAVKESVRVVVLVPEYVMRYSFYWALLKHPPGGGDQVKMRRLRFKDIDDICTIKESGETVATKVDGPGSDVMERVELAYHGSNAKEPCHFTAVRTLIGRSTGYDVHYLAPIVLRCSFRWNIRTRIPINTRFSLDSPGGGAILVFEGTVAHGHASPISNSFGNHGTFVRNENMCNCPAGSWDQARESILESLPTC
jgi:hypothetical protein